MHLCVNTIAFPNMQVDFHDIMNKYSKTIIVLCYLLFCGSLLSAQNKKDLLQQDKQKIEKEIQYNSNLLTETRKSKKTTLNELVLIKKQIQAREELIETINHEISATDQQISLHKEIIADLKKDLKKLKDEYAEMIYYAYKNRNSFDRLMYIFSASDFNQAYKRMQYFHLYASYRKNQAGQIEKTQQEIIATIEKLEAYKKEKQDLAIELEAEKNQLLSSRHQQNKVYQSLSSKEKKLAKTIREKEKAARKLQKEIESIIAEEIRLAAKKTGTTKSGSFDLTPEELKLSTGFTENKGRLPWPLEKGTISSTFGEHPHPVLKLVKIKNNGIDILTSENMKIRTVFNGEVTRVMAIPNYHYVIMIRHGEYLSVYSNLEEVYVQKGDQVTTKQEIGRVYTDITHSKTELHFELWKGKNLLNPELWLAK